MVARLEGYLAKRNEIGVALARVPLAMLALVYDILERLSGVRGAEWAKLIADTLQKGLPEEKSPECVETVDIVTTQLSRWVELYRTHFGIELDPGEVRIPEHREGFDRLSSCGGQSSARR